MCVNNGAAVAIVFLLLLFILYSFVGDLMESSRVRAWAAHSINIIILFIYLYIIDIRVPSHDSS